MAGKVLVIQDYLTPERMACNIAEQYIRWEAQRQVKVAEWTEVAKYVFATDTSKTTNSKLPWKNTTTIPKLCQIRDNLLANYIATMFPKRKWMQWLGNTKSDADVDKKKAIESYMLWAVQSSSFMEEATKLVLDYIDYGNCFGMPVWIDERVKQKDKEQTGYVGPSILRLSPIDMNFNPVATSFREAPKIVRSMVSIGEAKDLIEKESVTDDDKEDGQKLFDYLLNVRAEFGKYNKGGTRFTDADGVKDSIYNISGFDSWTGYLDSNYCEILTFYGDVYDDLTNSFKKNQVIKIIDRHRILSQRDNPSVYGYPPIYHAGWRVRQDNLWAMGPLDNLIGMQYRIDHLENLKADCFDQIAFPPLKIKGYVEDFEWGPFERIYVGDDGDVEVLSPDVQALQADNQIALLESKMEEMAGSPKEAMGFRTPGEKTAYEVQRLENAAARIFQNKIAQFERQIIEPMLNGMLELARRYMSPQTIRAFDNELKIETFLDLTPQDITGNGQLKPIAARHFAEQATLVQDLNSFYSSAAGQDQDVLVHFSGYKTARLWENLLHLEDYEIVQENVRISEKADAQKMAQINATEIAQQSTQQAGIAPEDATQPFGAQ